MPSKVASDRLRHPKVLPKEISMNLSDFGRAQEEGSMAVGYHQAAGKSSFFDENQGFRSEGLQKSESAVLVPPWRIENLL